MLERLFQLSAKRTNLRTEIIAGLTTFAAMAYILAVNPAILSASGMDTGALITATALASALMTAAMGLATNYPIALAPGMGMNAFFAFTICLGMKIPWQAALGMTFMSGILFLMLSVTGLRQKLFEGIPRELKTAVACGIGLFIVFIGLKNGGVVVSSPATLVTFGKIGSPSTLLVLFGIVLTAVLQWRRVRGAVIIGVLTLSALGLFLPAPDGKGTLTQMPQQLVAAPASLAPTFLQMDLKYVFANLSQTIPLILALLFVDVFDNMGTLIGVAHRIGILDKDGNFPRIERAFIADAGAAMTGACLGTSTVTSYIESAAGVEEGGRTGLTSIVVSICFLLALFLHPLIRAIPAVATAPALVIVGLFMLQSGLAEVDFKDFSRALPALLIMILMPLTFSINEGLAIGFVVYVLFMAGIGRAREVSWMSWILGGLFLLFLISR